MATTLMTPGVYIEEKNAFPGSAVAVATAVPAFIGYTQKADRGGKTLLKKPVRITSFAEYVEHFGEGFTPKYELKDPVANSKEETIMVNGAPKVLAPIADNHLYFYNAIKLFYANGGSTCYIVSVGTYEDKTALKVNVDDFNVLDLLEKEFEPTLIVMPDIVALGDAAYDVYKKVLDHCAKTQSRFGIFDVSYQTADEDTGKKIKDFREGIGVNFLNYGAAYYPWLKTSITSPADVTFDNLAIGTEVKPILDPKETKATEVVDNFAKLTDDQKKSKTERTNYHQSLMAASPSYVNLLAQVRNKMNELPPSAAMAGLYTMVDSTRGVWKSPANISLNSVVAPMISLSNKEQEDLNVDVIGGKSVNAIRPFPGLGPLVWGARTLDGNSQDWRYINVRRTIIMIEQSLKLATRAYVFEPNDSSTWVTISSMINNFLFNLWKQGALAGAAPEQAYEIQIGLGQTMTPTDILDGIMRITVKLAVVRPAEFIVITFQQQQQQS